MIKQRQVCFRHFGTNPFVRTPYLFSLLLGSLILGCSGSQPATTPQTVTTSGGMEMAFLSGGEFLMGDDRGEEDEKPAHRVRVSPFYMDVCEVTQASYESLMGKNPSKFTAADHPAERVSWYAATQYCNMRSLREGLRPCYDAKTGACDFMADGYRLPTEAEWEYACRAGTVTPWCNGSEPGKLGSTAWFKGNASKATHPVRQKSPNAWGLYDMHGNVAEWCNDVYREGYGVTAEADDPHGPAAGDERVLRGGNFAGNEDSCRSSARSCRAPICRRVLRIRGLWVSLRAQGDGKPTRMNRQNRIRGLRWPSA